MKKKIAITGKTSRVAKTLKKYFFGPNIIYLEKKKFDILNFKQINNFLKKNKIKTLVHMAALSRPMKIHKENINKSIEINIIISLYIGWESVAGIRPGCVPPI